MKQKHARYEMHKYWGKKPAFGLEDVIKTYSKKGDILFDPFAGYGVFGCESLLKERNIILNDLNPIACFIQEQLLSCSFDEESFREESRKIFKEIKAIENDVLTTTCKRCGKNAIIISTLRNKEKDTPECNKIKCSCSKQAFEQEITEEEVKTIKGIEKKLNIPHHPVSNLLQNSRISAKENMTTDDLFTQRTLYCHSLLFNKIQKINNDEIKKYMMLAFLSNLANCSKLVPPIKTRGKMSQGAWMTGFYIAGNYIENNVFHYFKNRLEKIILGKADYLNNIKHVPFEINNDKQQIYTIKNEDAKNLSLESNSIDYIFTDPPYGDTVPYFEQSIIWNTWLSKDVDYNNEIVISDSKKRTKNVTEYKKDLNKSIHEISRVLKNNKYFTISFHSLYGEEWSALIDACFLNGFSFEKADLIKQKTLAPRQLNRKITIEGDLFITFRKTNITTIQILKPMDLQNKLISIINNKLNSKNLTTNEIYLEIINYILNNRISISEIDIISMLKNNFNINEDCFWEQKPLFATLARA